MKVSNYLLLVSVFVSMSLCFCQQNRPQVPEEEKTSEFWQQNGQRNLYDALRMTKNVNKAKNVILFLGDGMGMTTVTAARIHKGQMKNQTGESEKLTFDKFPHVSLSKTYGVDRQLSDSANTATAYLCGVKANYGTVGVNGHVQMDNCESSLDKSTHVKCIAEWAQEEGKWTGVVTSTRVTHATPSGTYAHTASRNWEAASPDPRCKDIADQLVNDIPGKNIRVVMGGGRSGFLPAETVDVDGVPGKRNDSRNLLQEWRKNKADRNQSARIVFNVQELIDTITTKVDNLLGLFHPDHMPYVTDRPDLNKTYPSLVLMTQKAIEILRRSEDGFFLLVEGGKIDIAHHFNEAGKALKEAVEFDAAIAKALEMTNPDETLIVVTADHSHTFTIGGDYPMRGTDVRGIGGVSDIDNKTFTTLGYYNGPGYKKYARERNLTQAEALDKDFRQDAALPVSYETHGAEDVPVYATGPNSHLYHGVHEQSYIPYVMGYAACIGPNQELCSGAMPSSSFTLRTALQALLAVFINYFFSFQRTVC